VGVGVGGRTCCARQPKPKAPGLGRLALFPGEDAQADIEMMKPSGRPDGRIVLNRVLGLGWKRNPSRGGFMGWKDGETEDHTYR